METNFYEVNGTLSFSTVLLHSEKERKLTLLFKCKQGSI